ncbi:cutinase family protein [Actinomadura sp. KC345]|uniref:cutinase family protein n=1 Tax=Actinomadura sp. KC345 TaxID=2530371 RepID=UPI00104DBCF9|nr:cutinase family protein [Actinomadura sp. KC345]TDC46675.1 cutinase family protein [Actinomadura sp. KC345]
MSSGSHARKSVIQRYRRPATVIAVAGAVAAAAAVPLLNSDNSATAARASEAMACTPIKLIVVPGTWETTSNADPNTPVGMLRGVTEPLEQRFGDRISSYWVGYHATAFDQGKTYADSKQTGIDAANKAMTDIARACPGTRFVGLGFSQGAHVNGDVAAAIGAGKGAVPAGSYIAGGSVADPARGTKGEVNLGDPMPGTKGIAGPRPQGFGSLSGKVANVCLKGDLYCALPEENKLSSTLGTVLGQVGLANMHQSAQNELATDLGKVNGKPADLSTVPTGVKTLAGQARGKDSAAAARTAGELAALVGPLQALTRAVANPMLVNSLLQAPPGSQNHTAGQVLQALNNTDLVGLATDLDGVIAAAKAGNTAGLAQAALAAAAKAAPLTGLPAAEVAKVTKVIQGLQPVALLAQASNIIGGISKIDYQGIQRAAKALPAYVQKGDARGVYRSLVAIEDKLLPLAKTANRVDLTPLAALLSMWPPGSPERAVGEALVILDRVDWVRITRNLRTIQDKLDNFDPKRKVTIDPANPAKSLNDFYGVDLLSMAPQIADLAEHGLGVAGVPLPKGTLNQLLKTQLSPAHLINEGLDAAVFYGTRRHEQYGTAPVDQSGRSALIVLENWLAQRIEAA